MDPNHKCNKIDLLGHNEVDWRKKRRTLALQINGWKGQTVTIVVTFCDIRVKRKTKVVAAKVGENPINP